MAESSSRTLSSARVISAYTLLSRMLGLVRDVLCFQAFGAVGLSAFLWAWTLPNLFRRILGEGAFGSAFIPIFTRHLEGKEPERAWRFAGRSLSFLIAVLVTLTVIAELALWVFPAEVAAGFFGGEAAARSALELVAWLLPYLVFICLVGFLQGILNSQGHFAMPAFAPVLLNVFWIGGFFVSRAAFASSPDLQLRFLAASLLLGGLAQLLIQLPPLRKVSQGRLKFSVSGWWEGDLKELWRQTAPVILGLSAVQINLVVDRAIAQAVVGPSANSVLFLGNRLAMLPLALIGVALGTAIFPSLSRSHSRTDQDGLRRTLSRALRIALGLAVPASVGLMILARPVTELFFEYRQFGERDAAGTAACIAAYAIGIPATCLNTILMRVFFARGEARRAMHVSVALIAVNAALTLALVFPLGAAGSAIATSLTSFVQLAWLLRILSKHFDGESLFRTGPSAWSLRLAVPPLLMGASVAACLWGLGWTFAGEPGLPGRITSVVLPVIIGVLTFLILARRFDPDTFQAAIGLRRRRSS
ncbi:MAG: murein biosynthesis integral membrane protein MurJ [Planctomycetota bacterium]